MILLAWSLKSCHLMGLCTRVGTEGGNVVLRIKNFLHLGYEKVPQPKTPSRQIDAHIVKEIQRLFLFVDKKNHGCAAFAVVFLEKILNFCGHVLGSNLFRVTVAKRPSLG